MLPTNLRAQFFVKKMEECQCAIYKQQVKAFILPFEERELKKADERELESMNDFRSCAGLRERRIR